MPDLTLIVLTNAALAAALGLVVLAVTSRWRAPRLVHLLWLLVLARLLVPPVMELGLLPPIGAPERPVAAAAGAAVPPVGISGPPAARMPGVSTRDESARRPEQSPPVVTSRWPAVSPWLAIWTMGALVILAIYGTRSIRFRRVVRQSVVADRRLVARAGQLGRRLGLSRPIRLSLTDEDLSPLVWPGKGGPVILLSRHLVSQLSDDEMDTVLAHELAHIRRRDHLVRRLEFVAGVLYWWHPVVWSARKRLRDAAEICCDEMVLAALPGSARAYAEGILKTIEQARGAHRLPALASGLSRFARIEERLTMIMNNTNRPRSSDLSRWLPITLAISALVVFPTFAERPPQSQEDMENLQRQEASAIERQAVDLAERQLELSERQFRAQRELQIDHVRLELERMNRQADEAAEAGRMDEAAAIRAEMERMERDLDHRLAQARFESEHRARQHRAELELRRAAVEIEALEMDGRQEEAALLRAEAMERQAALERDRLDGRAERMRLQGQAVQERARAMAAERERLEAAGELAQAEQLEHETASAELAARQMQLAQAAEQQRAEMELQYRQMQRDLEQAAEQQQALLAAEQRQLEARLRQLNDDMLDLNQQVEGDNIRLELVSRIRDLRSMVEYLGDDGELSSLLDRLEATAMARLEANQP